MRSAAKLLTAFLVALSLGACAKSQSDQNQGNMVDENLAAGQLPPNADIETLPPDESSDATNGELEAGNDNPDVNVDSNAN